MFPDAIPQSSLCAGFRCCGLPQGFEFRKICFGDPPLHQSNAVDMAKGRMIVMDSRDKQHISANPQLHLTDGVTRESM
jgi:hypothetical protein